MPRTARTPHAIAVEGGANVFVSHADYLDHLYSCADRWSAMGERAQSNLVRRKILEIKRRGERRCAVCAKAAHL